MSETFPIMFGYRADEQLREVRKGGQHLAVVSLPWAMLAPHEDQAQRNHSQSLKRLAERGGLSACEAVAILEDRRHQRMNESSAHRRLAELLSDWTPVSAPVENKTGPEMATKAPE